MLRQAVPDDDANWGWMAGERDPVHLTAAGSAAFAAFLAREAEALKRYESLASTEPSR